MIRGVSCVLLASTKESIVWGCLWRLGLSLASGIVSGVCGIVSDVWNIVCVVWVCLRCLGEETLFHRRVSLLRRSWLDLVMFILFCWSTYVWLNLLRGSKWVLHVDGALWIQVSGNRRTTISCQSWSDTANVNSDFRDAPWKNPLRIHFGSTAGIFG